MKISCVIPLYRAEKYIIETLDSLLAQTYPLDEILVIDDCGGDRSAELVEQYSKNHPVVRLIHQSHNQGGSAARNRGLKEANNTWVLMMDADDIIHPELLAKQVALLQSAGEVLPAPVCVHPAYVQTDAEGNILDNSEYRGQQLSFDKTFAALLIRNYIITPSGLLLHRETALQIGGYRTTIFISEDAEFILRLARKGSFLYLDEPYVYFRRHPMSITSDLNKASKAGQAILDIYTLDEIKEAIFGRDYSEQQNHFDFATLLYQYQRYDEGYEELTKITEEKFRQSKLFLQSIFYQEKEQWQKAERMLEELLEQNPEHGAALNNRAVLYAMNGNTDQAIVLWKKALQFFPGYMDAKDNLKCIETHSLEYRFTKRELRANLLRYS
ncbi:glycosyltransferase [Paenibacillus hunanensis]|uniref:glycosyltransferase n=1 Tax=Paenibacillus hunanensis TaxID=539262 RepID=UPI002026D133|nr:glycosyltransferase [Paenibacillus hunanensis]MCL9662784.1 glycosyltransferase [Paenibacillus hunanensis]